MARRAPPRSARPRRRCRSADLAAAADLDANALSAAASSYLAADFGLGPDAEAVGGAAGAGICFSASLAADFGSGPEVGAKVGSWGT